MLIILCRLFLDFRILHFKVNQDEFDSQALACSESYNRVCPLLKNVYCNFLSIPEFSDITVLSVLMVSVLAVAFLSKTRSVALKTASDILRYRNTAFI